jgi:hypothetical protein
MSKIRYDRTSYACIFKPGDKVWVRDFKPDPSLCKKFCNAWRGPYTVLQRIDNVIYKLKPDKAKGRVIQMHRNNLKVCIPRIVDGNQEEKEQARSKEKVEEKSKKQTKPAKVTKQQPNERRTKQQPRIIPIVTENSEEAETDRNKRVLRPRPVT